MAISSVREPLRRERSGTAAAASGLQVYGHVLPSTASVVDWMSGTSLTRFRRVLAPERYEEFVAEYRRRLLAELGDHAPYFYAFKRILMWGRTGI